MQKFNDILRSELERLGLRIIRTIRDPGICQWNLVRDTASGQLLEIESYDRGLTNATLLLRYKNRCLSDRNMSAPSYRVPAACEETERAVSFIRPYVPGEPLHQVLLRPSRLHSESLERQTLSLCRALRSAASDAPDRVREVVTNLYVTEAREILVDAFAAGPWITVSAAERALTQFVPADLQGTDLARYFAIRIYARLCTGEVDTRDWSAQTLAAERRVTTCEAAILERISSRPHELFWLDAHLRKSTGRRIWPLQKAAILIVIAALAAGARLIQNHRMVAAWKGETSIGRTLPDLTAAPDSKPESPGVQDAPKAPSNAPRSIVSDAVISIDRQSKYGDFRGAMETVGALLTYADLTDTERVILTSKKTDVESRMELEFQQLISRAIDEMDKNEFVSAKQTCLFIMDMFPEGEFVVRTKAQEREIDDRKRQFFTDLGDHLQHEGEQTDADRSRLQSLVKLRRRTYGYGPGFAMQREFQRYSSGTATDAAHRLIATLERLHDNEQRLIDALIRAHHGQHRNRFFANLKGSLPGRITGKLDSVDRNGISHRDAVTFETVAWEKLDAFKLYRVFDRVLEPEVAAPDTLHFQPSLFCLGRGLERESDDERKLIGSPDLRKELQDI